MTVTGTQPQLTAMSDREQQQMSRKHVFCVNGSSSFLEFVRMLLEEESYNVTTTNFVPATFVQIVALSPDLLIIDLEVGRRAGFELLEQLRVDAITTNIPVVVVSTDESLLDEARAGRLDSPLVRYIAKPFDIESLLGSVHALIGSA